MFRVLHKILVFDVNFKQNPKEQSKASENTSHFHQSLSLPDASRCVVQKL